MRFSTIVAFAVATIATLNVNATAPERGSSTPTIKIEKIGDHYLSPVPVTIKGHDNLRKTQSNDYQTIEYQKIDEDFSRMPQGTVNEPAEVCPFGANEEFLDVYGGYTAKAGWTGNWIWAADGALLLNSTTPDSLSFIRTPKGDYSGHLTVTFKAKALTAYWKTLDDSGNVIDATLHDGTLEVYPIAYDWNTADTNLPESYYGKYDIQLTDEEGWVKVTLEFDNYTADNEGCIAFGSRYKFLIDDIQITTSTTFIAAPTMLEWSNVTNTSFTANWMPVERAWDYLVHLFVVDGVDENGNPVLKRCYDGLSEDEKAEKEEWAREVESGEWPDGEPYLYWGATYESNNPKATSWTFTGLDSEKEYYVAVVSHCVKEFSDIHRNVYHAMVVAKPDYASASDIYSNAYTAHWECVAKADKISVNNYGVYNIKKNTEQFPLFEESFSGLTADVTSATGLSDQQIIEGCDAHYLDQYTSTPGWIAYNDNWYYSSYGCSIAQGKIGDPYGYGAITTPNIYCQNADKITLAIGLDAGCTQLYIKFGGAEYRAEVSADQTEYEFELPTNGMIEGPIEFLSANEGKGFMLDYVNVYQDVKMGQDVFRYLGTKALDKGATDCAFTDLSTDYDQFAFNVSNWHEYNNPFTQKTETAISAYMTPYKVAPSSASLPKTSIIQETLTPSEENATHVYYDLTGRRVAQPQHGIYIRVAGNKAVKVKR